MYKFVTKEQYEKDGWKLSHPKARCSSDGGEYVLSNAGNLTKQQAIDYINKNWPKEESN